MRLIYKKIEEGADVNFVFGAAYGCPEAYTPLMSACHRGRLDAAKALLRSGADPNYMNLGGDLTLFWGIDGGPELVKLRVEYGVDLDARNPKDWTALSYAKAMGKYGLTTEKGTAYRGFPKSNRAPFTATVRTHYTVMMIITYVTSALFTAPTRLQYCRTFTGVLATVTNLYSPTLD